VKVVGSMSVSKISHSVKGQIVGVVETVAASFGVFPGGDAGYSVIAPWSQRVLTIPAPLRDGNQQGDRDRRHLRQCRHQSLALQGLLAREILLRILQSAHETVSFDSAPQRHRLFQGADDHLAPDSDNPHLHPRCVRFGLALFPLDPHARPSFMDVPCRRHRRTVADCPAAYKAITGRAHPLRGVSTDLTHVFRFGLLRGGVFWGWPSSHTTIAFAMAVTIFMLFPKQRSLGHVAIIYALYVGIGVSMTIHWFSDFVAGAIIGTVIGVVVGRSFGGITSSIAAV